MTNSSVSTGNITKRVAKTHELISTSYHEAGHTVYGLLHLMKIETVYVFEGGKSRIDGFTHYEYPDFTTVQDPELFNLLLNNEICMKYAGLAAEKNSFKEISGSDKFPMVLRDGSSDDTLNAAKLIKAYNIVPPGKKRYLYKKKLVRQITQELRDNWDAVTAVAHGLFQKKKLYFFDLKDILTKKTKNKEFWKEQFKNISSIHDNADTLTEESFKLYFI